MKITLGELRSVIREISAAHQFDDALFRVNDDPSIWGSEVNFVEFAQAHGFMIESSVEFLYATKQGRYYGFYDRYAGDGLLLNDQKHPGFENRDQCLDALIDD